MYFSFFMYLIRWIEFLKNKLNIKNQKKRKNNLGIQIKKLQTLFCVKFNADKDYAKKINYHINLKKDRRLQKTKRRIITNYIFLNV